MKTTDNSRRRECQIMLDILLQERPAFHGWNEPGSLNYALSGNVLQWIAAQIPEGCVSLETGCGYSTLVFAALSRKHTTISLFTHEHALVQRWAKTHGLETDHVQWLAGHSQEHLPRLSEAEKLDVVLIDGDHAFPAPFMDWYWTADRLRAGGILLVDDIQLATGRVLMEFLQAERERWRCLQVINNTAVFQRLGNKPAARGVVWTAQPWVKEIPVRESGK